ncbi:S8 family peptidase [Clostridium gasigenes]|uniref:Subtilase family protein n=1 Tax=Clostridium gasigenes TaxID=94869 RepID=A0A1H0R359_9CLOT|nr:S8 family peptidase [Clostridium gasigenes]MBB6622908.1 S8 family peptidase [Clostridium gasigenes]NKF06100.1 S8 family peptidase [Clostridium gasigenes]QSW19179.1 S8 family peptidase [Clostridium gasigenes]SDP23917.1 Subtilase family protein [Clostridium gasigenes]
MFVLDENRALLSVVDMDIDEVVSKFPDVIIYKNPVGIYTLTYTSPVAASGAEQFHNNLYLPLDGEGVIVGIVDTGIDYLNEEFINPEGTSRILSIWDQTINTGKRPDGQPIGSEYTRDDINNAINAKNQGADPYDIVPSRDEIGHGTNMAGIVGGRGVRTEFVGTAPKCDFAVVKLLPASKRVREEFYVYGNTPTYSSVAIYLGIKYLYELALKLEKPIVILIPLGYGMGSHDGLALNERYIDEISRIRGIAVVVPNGNEGDSDTHTSGLVAKEGDVGNIELIVDNNQKNLRFEIWISKPDKLTLSITSPSGEIIDRIPPRNKAVTEINFIYEKTKMFIQYLKPEEITGDEKITIVATNITGGIWNFKIVGELVSVGIYNAYLPQQEILAPNTKFLRPDPNGTLMIPSTSRYAISVGFYDQTNNAIEVQSGRGYTRDGRIKPEIVAGGVNALTTSVGGGPEIITGSSVAAAVVAGCCALIFQWGIIDGKDKGMYSIKLKTYLIRGAQKRQGDEYPNPQWGFGSISMKGVFDNIRGLGEQESRETPPKINYFFDMNNRSDLIEYKGDIVNALKRFPNTDVYIIDEKRAVITVPYEIYSDVLRLTPEIVYADPNAPFTTCDISPVEASGATVFHNNVYLPLDGSGVIVGIIDTGIDYLNEEFINEDGTSRILVIVDRTIEERIIEGKLIESQGPIGIVYTQEDINRAIEAKKNGGDPYVIVPSKDEIGHGTNMAGIVAARGANPDIVGVAPRCNLAIIKLSPVNEAFRKYYGIYGSQSAYQKSGILLGIRHLYNLAVQLKKPIVIYIPLGSNTGPHNGDAFIEKYISEISRYNGVAVVVPTGNQGNTDTHTSGIIENKGDTATIEIEIGRNQKDIRIEIWISKPDKVALSITSPTGEVIRKISPKLKSITDITFVYEETKMTIEYFIPEELSGDQKIIISARNIKEGIWQFELIGELIIVGKYDAWIIQRELLAPNTKFLSSTSNTTLTNPGTSNGAITVAFYNQNNNSIVPESGKGYTRDNRIKPDIAAGGINAITTAANGGTQIVSGSSVAGAVTAGACALLFQWGIIDGNDTTMYATKVKTYLIRGASKRAGDIYPNPQWGYGMLNIKGIFDNIRGLENKESRQVPINKKVNYFLKESNMNIMLEYRGDIVNAIKKFPDSDVYVIDERRAVITIPYELVNKVLNTTPEIVYADPGSALTLCDISPVVASEAPLFYNNEYLPLDGSGVIVGIIDTGIDYLNEEFINKDGTSRIISIYDQNIEGDTLPSEILAGSIYTQEDINKAIQAKRNGEDPYAIVPSKDEIGHGTNMAGIIGARGANPELIGVAPNCSIAVVKMRPGNKAFRDFYALYGDEVSYKNTALFLAQRYLYMLASKLNKPIVIYSGTGTNNGSHTGESFTERYSDEITSFIGVAVVYPTGNQGNTATHTSGTIKKTGDMSIIELKIGENQKDIRIEIWISKPDKVSLTITSPTGEVIKRIPPKLKEITDITFVYEETRMTIEYFIPEEISGDQKIVITARNIRDGIWQFKLIGELIVVGKYDSWISQRELLAPGTRFLRPNPYTTLTLPGTAINAITVAYYNQNNNSIMPQSGRGYTRNDMVKPDIAAGGINAKTTAVGGTTKIISGSSVAGAVVAGACALLFQWGIIDGNDPTMYATKLKTYLIRGAEKRPGDVYPNPQWGYGMLNLKGVFDNVRGGKNNKYTDDDRMIESPMNEYYVGNLFIRLPEDF